MLAIRRFDDADFGDLVPRWHETNRLSYPYSVERQRHSPDDALSFFRDRVLPECEVWVAQCDAALVGVVAMQPPWIRQLAVFPEFQRQGIGTALLSKARECSPEELRLYTFRRNKPARAFYEHHGFIRVAFGVSPPPEYRWTKRQTA